MLRLLIKNLMYHRRGNLAVLLGVALGTAVLTGALLVGDSLRGSLQTLALDQLGWIDGALVTNRFFRQALADELRDGKTAACLFLQGSAVSAEKKEHRANKVNVLGVDGHFWPENNIPVDKDFWHSDQAEVVLNASLARALNINVGDRILLNVLKADNIPRETIFSKRKTEEVLEALTLKVRLILPDQGMARFTLRPTPEPVRNAFVPIRFLQNKLERLGRANALLVDGRVRSWQQSLELRLTLEDWNLKLRTPEDRARAFVKILDRYAEKGKLKKARWQDRVPEDLAAQADAQGIITTEQVIAYFQKQRAYLNLESEQMYLDAAAVKAALAVCQSAKISWQARPVFVYLADSLSDGAKEVPYAVVAGVGRDGLDGQPRELQGLKDNEIVMVDWPGMLFRPKPGDEITLNYFSPDAANHLAKLKEKFILRATIPLKGIVDDADLTPEFPGITDKLDMASWDNPPFPYDPKRVKNVDENYWQRYRTTPRAYVSLETAQRLWGSRFGNLTSLRITPGGEKSALEFRARLLQELSPEQGGFVFQKVKELAMRSGAGSTDFGVYFLAFSFFLIAAALLLVGLLFRLNIDRRAGEMGVLTATGWSNARVRRLLMGEGFVLALVGGLAGLAGAGIYASLLLDYLRTRWPGSENLAFLQFHAEPTSFAIGYLASLAVSMGTIFWATRVLAKLSPRYLLAGQTTAQVQTSTTIGLWNLLLVIASLLGGLACMVAGVFVKDQEGNSNEW